MLWRDALAAMPDEEVGPLPLVRDLGECEFFGASPDGALACINVLSDPPRRSRDKWRGPLQVIDLSTWRVVFGGQFRARVATASFFADSRALFLETYPAIREGEGRLAVQQAIVEVNSGLVTDRVYPVEITRPIGWFAVQQRMLLSHRRNSRQRDDETLALVNFPEESTRVEVPFADRPRDAKPTDRGFALSEDRRAVACCFDTTLLFRNVNDLSVVWGRQIGPNAAMVEVEISARGDRVGIGFTSTASVKRHPGHYIDYITVHDGATGAEVNKFPVNARATAYAISPNGRHIAVALGVYAGKGVQTPTVNIYDIASGRLLASTVHNRIEPQPHQFLLEFCRPTFTSDSRYLITSGAGVKVWDLSALHG